MALWSSQVMLIEQQDMNGQAQDGICCHGAILGFFIETVVTTSLSVAWQLSDLGIVPLMATYCEN